MTKKEAVRRLMEIWKRTGRICAISDSDAEALAMAMDSLIENKPARWIQTDREKINPPESAWWRCSCCNMPALEGRKTIYCPNCGTRMSDDDNF